MKSIIFVLHASIDAFRSTSAKPLRCGLHHVEAEPLTPVCVWPKIVPDLPLSMVSPHPCYYGPSRLKTRVSVFDILVAGLDPIAHSLLQNFLHRKWRKQRVLRNFPHDQYCSCRHLAFLITVIRRLEELTPPSNLPCLLQFLAKHPDNPHSSVD